MLGHTLRLGSVVSCFPKKFGIIHMRHWIAMEMSWDNMVDEAAA